MATINTSLSFREGVGEAELYLKVKGKVKKALGKNPEDELKDKFFIMELLRLADRELDD